jgi:hypothetical protein
LEKEGGMSIVERDMFESDERIPSSGDIFKVKTGVSLTIGRVAAGQQHGSLR